MMRKLGLVDRANIRSLRLNRISSPGQLTATGRSNERYRRAILSTLAGIIARFISVAATFVTVPLTLNYLGQERYGLWMTISSAVVLLAFADFGLGNGLMNAIARFHGHDDAEGAAAYVSSAFFMMAGFASLGMLAFAAVYPFLPWQSIFHLTNATAAAEAGPTTLVVCALCLAQMPLGIVERVQRGFQEGFVHSLWVAIGNLLGLVAVFLAIRARAGLPWLVAAMLGGPILANSLNGVLLFGVKYRSLIPRWSLVDTSISRSLLGIGLLFLLQQVAMASDYISTNIVSASVLGLQAVTEISIFLKLFTLTAIVLSIVQNALWPAFGESIARGDFEWVKKTLMRGTQLNLFVSIAAGLFLILFSNDLARYWVGPEVQAPLSLRIALGVCTTIGATMNAPIAFFNGAGHLKLIAISSTSLLAIVFPVKFWMAQRYGITGIIWGTTLSYLITTAIPVLIATPMVLKQLKTRATNAAPAVPL